MKKVLMFTMASCPYCRNAHRWMDEVFYEHPEYKAVELEIIDENREPAVPRAMTIILYRHSMWAV